MIEEEQKQPPHDHVPGVVLGDEVQCGLDVHVAVTAIVASLAVPARRAAVGLAPAVGIAAPLGADNCRARTRLLCKPGGTTSSEQPAL